MNIEDKLYKFLDLYYALPQPISYLIGSTYRLLPISITMGSKYQEFSELCIELANDQDLIGEYVNHEFIRTVHAAEKTKFYKSHYAEHGVSFSSIKTKDDISRLPRIDKDTLKENLEDMIVPDQRENGLYLTTGGSSGTPVGFMMEKGISRAKEAAFIEHLWSSVGFRHGDRVAIIRGIALGRDRISRFEAIKNALMLSSYHLTEANVDYYINELNKYRPKFIQAYPSAIYLLARLMHKLDKRLDFAPMAILCGSENLYDPHIKLAEDIFGAKVLGWYGHAEKVMLAPRGSRGEYSFLEYYGVTELLDDQGKPVTEGSGVLCGTSLNNKVMPLIRYVTDDMAFKTPSLPSTPAGLVVGSIDGRRHEFIYSSENRPVSMTAINIHSDEFDALERFQFVQYEKGSVFFEFTSKAELEPATEKAIERLLMSKLLDGFDLQIRRVEEIKLSKNGKQTFLRQEMKPDE